MMDDETLLTLLKGGHLSMPDRISRGAWPHTRRSLSVRSQITWPRCWKHGERWFPCRWEHRPGEPVREGGTIERQGQHRYVYHSAAAHPLSPTTLDKSVETVFSSAREAAVHYLKLHLP